MADHADFAILAAQPCSATFIERNLPGSFTVVDVDVSSAIYITHPQPLCWIVEQEAIAGSQGWSAITWREGLPWVIVQLEGSRVRPAQHCTTRYVDARTDFLWNAVRCVAVDHAFRKIDVVLAMAFGDNQLRDSVRLLLGSRKLFTSVEDVCADLRFARATFYRRWESMALQIEPHEFLNWMMLLKLLASKSSKLSWHATLRRAGVGPRVARFVKDRFNCNLHQVEHEFFAVAVRAALDRFCTSSTEM